MKTPGLLASLLVAAVAAASPADAPLKFEDISGWWAADPAHGGETSHVVLRFVEKDGQPQARLWLEGIGAYDIDLGEITLTGNTVSPKRLSFPLTWNAKTQTLSGRLPSELVPVYEIPIVFKRGQPMDLQPKIEWQERAPKVVWSVDTGSPVWAGLERHDDSGMLLVGNEKGVLSGIDRDGKVRWTFGTGAPIRAQPKVIGGEIYVSSDSGYLYRLRMNGEEISRVRIAGDAPARIPTNQKETRWDRYGSSVVTDGRQYYVASRDKNLYAFELSTDRPLWHVAAPDIMTATPALYGNLVIYAAYDGKVRAVSRGDGSLRWSYDAKLPVGGDVVVDGERVLLGSRTYDLIALDAKTGRELWKHYYWFSWIESPPVVRDNVVYTGSSDATRVFAINVADGSTRWKARVPGYSWQRVAVDHDFVVAGTVGMGAYPGTRAGSLLALDRATGQVKWMMLNPPSEENAKAKKEWGFGASPVIAEGRVYAADLDGKVYAIELK